MSKVSYLDLEVPVVKRKHKIDKDSFVEFLRGYKANRGLTIKDIANNLEVPKTEVEHWFRKDNCFSIPSSNIWFDLKKLLCVTDTFYDKYVTEFVEVVGKYEKAGRFYSIEGVSPTITSARADENVITPINGGSKGMRNYTNEIVNGIKTENKRFRYASLFSGIGGFETALNGLGGECVFASEIDKYARQSYEVLYGHEPHGDITKIEAKDVPDHDILVGGFPCQAFSVAGKRGGFEDTRGTLIYDVVRIAAEKHPNVILLENVKGLIGHDKGATLDTIVKIINEIGYRVDFQVLNSKFFGVPQNRERIFIVCIREDLVDNEEWNIVGTNVVAKGKKRIGQYEGVKTFNFDYPSSDVIEYKLGDFLQPNVDERFYLSEDKTEKLVKQIEERGSKVVKDESPNKVAGLYGKSQAGSVYDTGGVSPTLDTAAGGYREPIVTIPTEHSKQDYRAVLTPDRTNKSQNGRQIKETDEPMFTLTAQDQHGVVTGVVGSTQANAFHGYGTESPALNSAMGQGGGHVPMPVYSNLRIRKLTPLECWRLQGFSDSQHDAVEKAGISNSQRYKQAGNAVTVNVIYAIGERLIPYL